MKFIVAKPVTYFPRKGECFQTTFLNLNSIECKSLVFESIYQLPKSMLDRYIKEKSIIIYDKEKNSVQLLHPNSGFLSIWGALYVTPSIYSNTNELAKRQYKDTESCREEYEV